ncbi:autoinducer 2-binding protein LsrB [Abditibacteriota bacterium]|nr:autoinducer 2-binding protein LsrB [Abditibacteriota bacterium]
MKLQYVGAALVLGGLCFLGGCAKSGDSTTTASSNSSTSGTSGAKQSVVYIPKNTGNAYFDSVITGFEKAGKEKGFDFTTVAPANASATSQIDFIKQQIQRGVNAIAISPNSPDALVPVLKEAMGKGIKVVTIDADLEKNENARDAVVLPVDFSIIGTSQIDLMSSLIGGKGDIAILSATTDAPNQNAWIAGMKKALTLPKYKGIKLVEVVYGDDEPQKSQRETEALLTKFPNLKGIIAPTSVGLVAAAQALETAQVAKKVQLTGLGLPNQMRRFVQNGTVQKFALWDPGKMGYAAGYLIAGMFDKSVKAAPGGSFKAGDLGSLKFGDKNTVVAGPPLVFDAKNIDHYKF